MSARSRLHAFLGELRRRRVFRVAVAYCAMAWVLIETSGTILPRLNVPDWTVTLLVVLAILGFPFAVVLAWVFDITPRGVERTPEHDAEVEAGAGPVGTGADHGRRSRTSNGPGPGSSTVPAIGVHAGAAAPATDPALPLPRSERLPLLCVGALPFVDRGPGGEHQYLGDGITEEIITALAGVRGLRVASRTGSFAFRGEGADVRRIGERLGVGSLVEGSLRVSGDRLRLTVQLVRTEDGYAIWSSSFDRRIEDLLDLQEEMAGAIVGALRRVLVHDGAPGEGGEPPIQASEGQLIRNTTRHPTAYTLYLRGRHLWNQRTPASVRGAMTFFRQAVGEDPGFAHAWAGLADCHSMLMDYGIVSTAEGLPPALEAARRALELGPGLPESHTSMALARQMELRWVEALEGFGAALAREPEYVVAHQRLALLLGWMGRSREAWAEMLKARELDAASPVIRSSLGWLDYYAGRFEEARQRQEEVLAEHPRFTPARVQLALDLLQLGSPDGAVEALRVAVADAPESSSNLSLLVHALGRAGRESEARARMAELEGRAAVGYLSPYYLAAALLGLGSRDRALDELERAARERAPQLVYLKMDPLWTALRSEPEFRELLRQLDFPPSPGPS